jgi:hypothetical protein
MPRRLTWSVADVDAFWRWFVEHARELEDLEPGTSLWRALSAGLERIGVEEWEIGPSTGQNRSFFAFALNGCLERVAQYDALRSRVPAIDGWDILTGKPPKQWQRRFVFAGVEVDASTWRACVYRYDDGFFEIVFLAPAAPGLSQAQTIHAATLVMESELGELSFCQNICAVDVDHAPDAEMFASAVSLDEVIDIVAQQTRRPH